MHGAARHLLALVRSLPSVLAHMNDKVVFPGKRLGTVLTAVRGLSRVLPHVNHQVLFSREYFRAVAARVLLALVRSLARMLANVVRQVVLARKRLRAVLTAVRRLSRVRPDVNHQVLLPGEGLAAPRLPSVQRKASLTRQPSLHSSTH